MTALYRTADLKRASFLCAIVGSWLVLFNQGSVLMSGAPFQPILYLRLFLDYATPFAVSSVTSLMRNRNDMIANEVRLQGR